MTLQGILALYETHSDKMPVNGKHTLRKSVITVLSTLTPLIATVGRSIVFWYVIDSVCGVVGLDEDSLARLLISVAIGGGVASLIQLKFESDSIRDLIHNLCRVDLEALKSPKKVIIGGF